MENLLSVKIEKFKNIDLIELKLPMEAGLYALTGVNGIGKSTIMTVISKVIRKSAFDVFQPQDYSADSKITISYNNISNVWMRRGHSWRCNVKENISLKGFYEGSIIHGMRFSDANYDTLLKAEKVKDFF